MKSIVAWVCQYDKIASIQHFRYYTKMAIYARISKIMHEISKLFICKEFYCKQIPVCRFAIGQR